MAEKCIEFERSWINKVDNLYNPIDELVNIMKKRFLNDPRLRRLSAEQQVIMERDIKREAVNMGKRMTKKIMLLYFNRELEGE